MKSPADAGFHLAFGIHYAKGNIWNELPSLDGSDNYATTRDYARYAKENGYDGVIIKNLYDTAVYASRNEDVPSDVVIALESNQIKSVYNENPTEDADIRYALHVEDIQLFDNDGKAMPESDRLSILENQNLLKAIDENRNKTQKFRKTPDKCIIIPLDETVKDSGGSKDVIAKVSDNFVNIKRIYVAEPKMLMSVGEAVNTISDLERIGIKNEYCERVLRGFVGERGIRVYTSKNFRQTEFPYRTREDFKIGTDSSDNQGVQIGQGNSGKSYSFDVNFNIDDALDISSSDLDRWISEMAGIPESWGNDEVTKTTRSLNLNR